MRDKKEVKKRISWKWFVILIVIAVVIYIGWFFFFSAKECTSWDCFNNRLEECSRTNFIGGTKMIFEYNILKKSGDSCKIDVELLQGELNNQESIKLEGQKMTCTLPLGVRMIPESDISNCHGLLKEGLQDIIIKRLYNNLVENIGQINLEVLDVPVVD